MATRHIVLTESGRRLLENARWCDSFLSKLRGFMFASGIEHDEGLVLVEKRDGRTQTSIHMFFVSFDLGVVWVNDDGRVVDKVVAKSWRPHYAPQEPARYVIEMHPDRLDEVAIGDQIEFREP